MESKFYCFSNVMAIKILLCQGGLASRQDCTQFEDALRRLYALELKLTDQVRFCVCCLLYIFVCVKGV